MKTILITSISRGIGKALAQKFLAQGHHVIGTHFSPELDYSHERLSAYPLDLTRHDSVESCANAIKSSGIKVDVLINNAGTLIDNDDTRVIVEKLRQTLEINLIGTIDFTENILTSVSADGHIINISSSAGSLAGATDLRSSHYPYHYPSYKISKAALNMYTRTLALRLAHEGSAITVSSVHPGWVKTEMGGEDAPMTADESAEHIYKLALSRPESGQFWFKGETYPW